VNTTTGKHLPAQMRASDADRDAVVSDLSAHFQAGRLTAGELDQRTGQALAARTWGELAGLLADLPPARSAPQAPAATSAGARPPRRRSAPPAVAALACIAITAAVLVTVTHGQWGFLWLLLGVLVIARRLVRYHCAPGRCGQED